MESLLTLSIGEYSAVEITLRLAIVLISMTALLMVLATGSVARQDRMTLILPAVALAGAAWFESSVWVGWKEAFELTGSAYSVTGHLLAGEDRIMAWSLGVPATLFAIGMACLPRGRHLIWLAAAAVVLALATPFSNIVWFILYCWICWQIRLGLSGCRSSKICILAALTSVAIGFLLNTLGALHLFAFGGVASMELVQGEISRSIIDIISLVSPALFLLLNILAFPRQQPVDAE